MGWFSCNKCGQDFPDALVFCPRCGDQEDIYDINADLRLEKYMKLNEPKYTEEGAYSDNENKIKNGLWKFYRNGSLYLTGNYIDGKRDGLWQEFSFGYNNKLKSCGYYKADIKIGSWLHFKDEYYEVDWFLATKLVFNEYELNNFEEYHQNGSIRFKGTVLNLQDAAIDLDPITVINAREDYWEPLYDPYNGGYRGELPLKKHNRWLESIHQ